MRRRLALLAGLALVAGTVLPVLAVDAREPREPREPGEPRSAENDGGGPSARSGDASASNSANVVGGRGHVSQETSVETGDVVVGGTVEGTPDGRRTTSRSSGDGEPPPNRAPTSGSTHEGSESGRGDGVVSSEGIDAAPAGDHAGAAGPDRATWIVTGVMLVGFAVALRKLPKPDPV